jgi:hypothetical protein
MFFSKKFIRAMCIGLAALMGLGVFAVVFNVIF